MDTRVRALASRRTAKYFAAMGGPLVTDIDDNCPDWQLWIVHPPTDEWLLMQAAAELRALLLARNARACPSDAALAVSLDRHDCDRNRCAVA